MDLRRSELDATYHLKRFILSLAEQAALQLQADFPQRNGKLALPDCIVSPQTGLLWRGSGRPLEPDCLVSNPGPVPLRKLLNLSDPVPDLVKFRMKRHTYLRLL